MYNTVSESSSDTDFGSGGALVLPVQLDSSGGSHLLNVGAGKDGNIYIVNRSNMGKFNSAANDIYQELAGALPNGAWSMPAYFPGNVYYGGVSDSIRDFGLVNAKFTTSPLTKSSHTFGYPGVTPSISSNAKSDAILWAAENTSPAVLWAYNATNLATVLYNSNQAGTRDQFGDGNKFITPMIANGKVYVGTTTGVGVFGLLSDEAKR
jgi:hypothetical protein